MQDYTKTDGPTLCVLLREQLLEMDKAKTIPSIYLMDSRWESAAKFVRDPYYWRHNFVNDLVRLDKSKGIDLSAWPLAAEAVRRWRDTSIVVLCTRSDGTSYKTRINATEKEAREYFLGSRGEVLEFGKEVLLAPVVSVEVCDG